MICSQFLEKRLRDFFRGALNKNSLWVCIGGTLSERLWILKYTINHRFKAHWAFKLENIRFNPLYFCVRGVVEDFAPSLKCYLPTSFFFTCSKKNTLTFTHIFLDFPYILFCEEQKLIGISVDKYSQVFLKKYTFKSCTPSHKYLMVQPL